MTEQRCSKRVYGDGYLGYPCPRKAKDLLRKLEMMATQGYVNEDAYGAIPEDLWDHFERVTGMKVEGKDRAERFSCSC